MMGLLPPVGVSAMPAASKFVQELLLARKSDVPGFCNDVQTSSNTWFRALFQRIVYIVPQPWGMGPDIPVKPLW